jgi:uncharacterized protein with HEPN domain
MDDRDRRTMERAVESARIAIEHVSSGGPNWRSDQKTVDAAAKRVEEVSEQLKRVSPQLQAALPGISWREAKAMRDVLAHDYGQVDVEILADVVESDLPALIIAIGVALIE